MLIACAGCVTHTVDSDFSLPDVPDWYGTRVAPEPDAEAVYFVGFSSTSRTCQEAETAAKERARAGVAAFLSTEVDWVFQFGTGFQGTNWTREALTTRVHQDVQGARVKDLCTETMLHTESSLFGLKKKENLSYQAGALVAISWDKVRFYDEMQRKAAALELERYKKAQVAKVLWNQGKRKDAIDELRDLLIDEFDNVPLLQRLALYEQESGELLAAQGHWRELLQNPELSWSVRSRARANARGIANHLMNEFLKEVAGGCIAAAQYRKLARDLGEGKMTQARLYAARLYDRQPGPFNLWLLHVLAGHECQQEDASADAAYVSAYADRELGAHVDGWGTGETARAAIRALALSRLLGIDETLIAGELARARVLCPAEESLSGTPLEDILKDVFLADLKEAVDSALHE